MIFVKEDSKKGESKSIKVLYFYTFWKTFLFAHEKTIEECLEILDKRAASSWLALNYEQQEQLLNNFIES